MTTPTAPSDLAPRALALAPDFELRREIGRGGMGVVYLARDVKLDRDVAVKVLPEALAADPDVRERFIREARTAARLSHPSIVPIYRADELRGVTFFVMGFVDGESLADRLLATGPLDPHDAAGVLRDVAGALDYAHARGVVHRDVKPANVLLDGATGRALVTDFGIARLVAASPLTATGQVLGTVHYMSPEQVSAEDVDGRSDLYSLGVVAFQALAGRLPFENASAAAVLVAHVTKPAPPLATVAPAVPPALAAIVDRCLAKDRAARFQTGAELAAALGTFLRETPTGPRAPVRRVPPAPVAPDAVIAEGDAQALWRRAAELQAETGLHDAARSPTPPPLREAGQPTRDASLTRGYRLADARAAAEEAGISARYVERAAAELGLAPDDGRAALPVVRDVAGPAPLPLGRPTRIVYEVVVEREATPDDFELMLDTITRAIPDSGTVGTIGRSMRWSSNGQKRRVQISAVVRNGRTTIRVEEQLTPLVGSLFGGIMGGGGGGTAGVWIGIGANVFHNVAIGFGLWGVAIAASYGIARTVFSSRRDARARTLRQLTDDLASVARSGAPSP